MLLLAVALALAKLLPKFCYMAIFIVLEAGLFLSAISMLF